MRDAGTAARVLRDRVLCKCWYALLCLRMYTTPADPIHINKPAVNATNTVVTISVLLLSSNGHVERILSDT